MHPPQPVVVRYDAASEYRKLVAALAARAARMGSRDAEGAAQEALKRSIANPASRAAIEYYFHERPPVDGDAPEWRLEQLLGWLHAVLRFVVREERARAGFRREVPSPDVDALEVRDRAPDPLARLIDDQLAAVVRDCLSTMTQEYRTVLAMRVGGLKYAEISARLGVSENTVATWVRRATAAVTIRVRERLDMRPRPVASRGSK